MSPVIYKPPRIDNHKCFTPALRFWLRIGTVWRCSRCGKDWIKVRLSSWGDTWNEWKETPHAVDY